jgi:hypothetical protein
VKSAESKKVRQTEPSFKGFPFSFSFPFPFFELCGQSTALFGLPLAKSSELCHQIQGKTDAV